MENKKTKLTISGNPKKSFKDFSSTKNQSKKTVVIDNKSSKQVNRGSFNKTFTSKPTSNFKRGLSIKPNFPNKTSTATSDFERRKLAEQRATKKIKGDTDKDKKTKLETNKRQVKLTVSRALSD